MVRYFLDKNVRVCVIKDEAPTWKDFDNPVQIPQKKNRIENKTYADVLQQNNDFIKLKLFLDDGETFVCWVTKRGFFPLQINNMCELFDGRFNS